MHGFSLRVVLLYKIKAYSNLRYVARGPRGAKVSNDVFVKEVYL
jgi:hypothetical protein